MSVKRGKVMQRFMQQEEGVALITSLLMTLISLAIVMSVMYMISQNITRTGAFKRYKTALEASYGGTDIVMKEFVPQVLKNIGAPKSFLETTYGTSMNLSVLATDTCLNDKLTKETSQWSAGCNSTTSAKSGADFSFRLPSATGGQPYAIYSKIIDTIYGNTDVSGLQLEGAGVAESLSVITPQHIPYVYRLEIQAEKVSNATEQANMSVLYAY
jgi:Flp pilus assembly pilin Flp